MKKKHFYEKPSIEVVVLNQQPLLQTVSGDVSATMNGTFEEEDVILP